MARTPKSLADERTRLGYTDGYPMLSEHHVPLRSYGICAVSHPDDPHEGELHQGICAEDWARMLPFDIRERRRWHERLRHWWTAYGWLVIGGIGALGYLAVLLWIGTQYRQLQEVIGW
jgi:hypothetical protein